MSLFSHFGFLSAGKRRSFQVSSARGRFPPRLSRRRRATRIAADAGDHGPPLIPPACCLHRQRVERFARHRAEQPHGHVYRRRRPADRR